MQRTSQRNLKAKAVYWWIVLAAVVGVILLQVMDMVGVEMAIEQEVVAVPTARVLRAPEAHRSTNTAHCRAAAASRTIPSSQLHSGRLQALQWPPLELSLAVHSVQHLLTRYRQMLFRSTPRSRRVSTHMDRYDCTRRRSLPACRPPRALTTRHLPASYSDRRLLPCHRLQRPLSSRSH